MNKFLYKINPWLLPLMIILFVLEIFTFPFVVNVTYSDRSENPDYFLTYTTNKLRWDYNVNIKPNGVAELSLFDIMYGQNAESYNGDKIIAPGLENKNIIRLKNSSNSKIQYTAVLYKYDTTEDLPIKVDFANKDELLASKDYYLPQELEELENIEVIRAVKGSLKTDRIQDFDIGWEWEFHKSDRQDIKDTILGNKEILDETTVGFYIVVKEGVEEPDDGGGSGGGGIVIRPPKDEEPDKPDNPDLPEIPDEPEIPDQPDIPDIPENPEDPTKPDTPIKPGDEKPDDGDTDKPSTPGSGDPDDGIIKPEVPKTGDERLFEMYITLMIISGIVLIIMIIERRLEKKQK